MNPLVHPTPLRSLASLAGAIALALALSPAGGVSLVQAGTLSGSVRDIPQRSVVNLSTNGTLDWVHWGLFTETSLNRKAGVEPQISDFSLLDNTNGFVFAYQYADNYNGYTWTDGDPIPGVTNTTSGVWAYGLPFIGTGFQITAPASTAQRTLKVYCGVFSGTGRLVASLSDGSAPEYVTTIANIAGGGSSGEVTLGYAANSPNQTLTVRWILQLGQGQSPNVTLQAAALSAEGVNNPPIIRLTSPARDANIALPNDVALAATASDLDGSVAKVEFFANGTKVGQDTTSPYSAAWSSPPRGRYTLTAVATDSSGESTTSAPVNITVHGNGGTLIGAFALPPTSVNLTAEGTADWQHWGARTSNIVNRKAVFPLIGELDPVGTTDVRIYGDNYTAFSWSDGAPVTATNGLNHGVFVYGLGNGFEFIAPADATARRLRVYAGLYGARGHFQAWLSDLSAPTYHNHSLSNLFGNDYGVFTLDYAAASPSQMLHVLYVSDTLYDDDFGNVTLQAVTLQGGGIPLLPVRLLSPAVRGADVWFSFESQSGVDYAAQWLETLDGGGWQTFANVPGTGGQLWITNRNTLGRQRVYRVETK